MKKISMKGTALLLTLALLVSLLTVGIPSLVAAGDGRGPVLFTENFDGTNAELTAAGWDKGSTVTLVNGRAQLNKTVGDLYLTGKTDAATWSDYTFEATVTMTDTAISTAGTKMVGMVAAANSSKKGLEFALLHNPTSGTYQVRLYDRANAAQRAVKTVSFALNTAVNMKMVLSGSQVTCYLNGTEVLNYTASGTLTGTVGLTVGGFAGEYDNLKVTSNIPEKAPAETLVFSDNFDSGAWASGWRMNNNAQYTGTLANGVAALGYNEASRNLYDTVLTDVRVQADVTVQYAYNTKANSTQKFTQYHLIAARSTNALDSGIEFGFKTVTGATASTLVVCLGNNAGRSNPLWESTETYPLGTTARLELYAVGSLITAVIDGKTVFDGTVADVPATGKCGITSRYAVSGTSASYTKAGYFDNFKVSTVNITDVRLSGTVVADADGGKADAVLISGDIELGTVSGVAVSVPSLAGKPADLYTDVEVTLTEPVAKTATAARVFYVADADKAVTSMADSRWTGQSVDKAPNFTLNPDGSATLNGTPAAGAGVSMLNVNDGAAYGNFYAEYTLTLSDAAAETNHNVSNVLSRSAYGVTNEWKAELFFDTRASQAPKKTFWARLTAGKSISYSDTFADEELGAGLPVTVGILVYDKTVTFTLNGVTAATYTAENDVETWFGLWHGIAKGTATVKDFLYIPLTKTLTDVEFTVPASITQGETATVTATPVYTWPYGKGEATAEGVTVTGLDTSVLGLQSFTVSWGGVSKSFTTVVTDEIDTLMLNNTYDTEPGGVLTVDGAMDSYTEQAYTDGYVEATVAVAAPSQTLKDAAATKTVFPVALSARNAGSEQEVRVRVALKKTVTEGEEDAYTANLQVVVYDAATYGAGKPNLFNVALADFAFGKAYTLRLAVIGNYIALSVDGEVLFERALSAEQTLAEQSGKFGFFTLADTATVTVDNFTAVSQSARNVTTAAELGTVIPQAYADVLDKTVFHPRNRFLRGETVKVTVKAPEGFAFVPGSLVYTVNGAATAIDESALSFVMPLADVELSADFEEVKIPEQYTPEFTENFNGTVMALSAAGWTDGDQAVLRDGRLYLADRQEGLYLTSLRGTETWTDYTVSVKVTLDAASVSTMKTSVATLVARSIGLSDGYEWSLCVEESGASYVRLYDRKGGAVVARVDYPVELGETYTLKLTVEGNTIRGYVNGEKLVDTTADSNTVGSVGLRRLGYAAYFDDLTVTLPEKDAPVADVTKQNVWFTETFESVDAMSDRGWNKDGRIEFGQLLLNDKSGTTVFLSQIAGCYGWTDYTAQADVCVTARDGEISPVGTNVSALVIRSQDGNSGYEFGVTIQSGTDEGGFRLYDRTTGTLLASTTEVSAKRGTVYRLTAVAEGNRIRCFVNGELVFDVTDKANSNPAGTVGLRAGGYTGAYDNIVVRKITAADKQGTLDVGNVGEKPSEIPQVNTGDDSRMPWLAVAVLALSLGAVLTLYAVRKREK